MVSLGRTFGENILSYKNRSHNRLNSTEAPSNFSNIGQDTDSLHIQSNTFIFYFLLVGAILLLFFRLVYLQIINGEVNLKRADQNRITIVNIPAPRGVIYDRNGEIVARNAPVFKIKREDGKWETITRDEAINLEVKGKSSSIYQQREYPKGGILSHVIGFIGEITEDELRNKAEVYKLGDFIGRMGVEESYESLLRGKDGKEMVETDALGKRLRVIQRVEPISGQNLTLSISASLTKVAQEALESVTSNLLYLGNKRVSGAVIVSNPINGEVLAIVSSPSFDPNVFSKQEEETILSVLGDKDGMPLLNRAISGTYPPGSTFKIITASSGLEEGKITGSSQIEDVGSFSIGQFTFPNWYFLQYGKKEGSLDVVGAIKRSNDIFFYKVAEMVGIDSLNKWMQKFNLGKPLRIDLPGEVGGNIPSDSWKRKNIGEGWYLGDTYHLGIGQGYLLVTPLQVNWWTSVIANGGKLCRPTVAKTLNSTPRPFDKLGAGFRLGQESQIPNSECKDLGIKHETIKLIKEGMREACSTGGTGWPLFDFKVKNDSASAKGKIDEKNFIDTKDGWIKIPVACKTGTAEFGDSQKKTHAWFIAFAPVENPEISVTVLVEGGGEGSNVAAPVAKKILEYYFR